MSFFDKKSIIAVVGATINTEKYGYKVLMNLKLRGYDAIGINPKYESIEGIKCYFSLKDVPSKIDLVVSVVPPDATIEILKEMLSLKIKKIWMQPGAESDEAINFADANGIECVSRSCIMNNL